MEHVASRGNVAVFSPYNKDGATLAQQYDVLFEGFLSAATSYPDLIDTNRVGFFGWSEGGGATPEMARRGIAEHGWGSQGVFLLPMAPWYALQIKQKDLTNDFKNAKLLMMVFSDDSINDHRMAIDIFNNMDMPLSEKDFMVIHPCATTSYTYQTEHNVPSDNPFDAYDYYAIYRHLDALADYAFTGNLEAKMVALGNGSTQQTFMGTCDGIPLTPVTVTDTPIPVYPETSYVFKWSSVVNPRRSMEMTGLTYSAWCDLHSLPVGQNGPTNDPDEDGTVNMLEYVMGLDPSVASAGGNIQPGFLAAGADLHPYVEFNRARLGSAQIRLEQATDLNIPQPWNNILYGLEVVGTIDADTERVRLLATEPWSGNSLFLRLRLGSIPSE
ncbi:MAG: hypothetical protein C0404_05395 [Verrucomicrobia bacterium]|nr:hypothetical protein [Verrucomicrobiota bacterium]